MELWLDKCKINKCYTTMYYLHHLLAKYPHVKRIELNVMIAGHTKFAPDQHFGHIKKAIYKSSVTDIDQLIFLINDSNKDNVALSHRNINNNDINIPINDWKSYLE